MKRAALIGLVTVLLGAAASWVFWHFEWVQEKEFDRQKGEAAKDRFYATRKLFAQLASQNLNPSERPQTEDSGPAGATIIYIDDPRALERRKSGLEAWVREGGHLVVTADACEEACPAFARAWLTRPQGPAGVEAPAKTPRLPRTRPLTPAMLEGAGCLSMNEEGPPAHHAYPGRSRFALCVEQQRAQPITLKAPVEWAVSTQQGHRIARVVVDEGAITIHNVPEIFQYRGPTLGDNALLINAVFDRGRVASLFFPQHPSAPETLLQHLWRTAWVALVLIAAVVCFFLWRDAPRLGPLLPTEQPVRRSMREQIRGNAHFLRRHGWRTLHQALRYALDEAASRRIAAYASLSPAERAQAIARDTGLDAARLTAALTAPPRRTPDLAGWRLIEEARRALLGAPPPSSHTSPSTSQGAPHATQP